MKVTTVDICPSCGFPLVSTMAFRYAEKYCMNCGGNFGMTDVPYVDITSKLKPFITKANKQFDKICKHLIGGGMRLRSCEKCNEGSDHLHHATPEESKKYNKALDRLVELKGSYGWR